MEIRLEQIDPDALRVVQRLLRYQHKAYLVGGCVRDLLLGRKPKDFDVATSATPNDIRRCFRNCRIIGRRFRLAHVFFGRKIIETATFRSNPRPNEDESGEATGQDKVDGKQDKIDETVEAKPADKPSDLLIRHDNVFGTEEEDARRRDFTINGLFFDVQSATVIDHVTGLPDLEARLVRTIGDPDIRFREDPVRILRAVKFAARCDLTIEAETYRSMMEHKAELAKCAQARVTEEFYRLLRAGAARRSFELLVETGLLEFLLPEMAQAWKSGDDDPEVKRRIERFWAYLRALDESIAAHDQPPSDAMILATLLLPPLRDALSPDAVPVQNMAKVVADSVQPVLDRLKASRRDSELCRQILLTLRYLLPSNRPARQRARLANRPFYQDAAWLGAIVAKAEGFEPPVAIDAMAAEAPADAGAPDEELPPELLVDVDDSSRGRRDRQRGRSARPETPAAIAATVPVREPRSEAGAAWQAGPRVLTPIPNLEDLGFLPLPGPAFLGRGGFGGRWAVRSD
ncbi:MAG TPA: polynucleotide adenylyltransferase PcnB [Polyangia bacterium]